MQPSWLHVHTCTGDSSTIQENMCPLSAVLCASILYYCTTCNNVNVAQFPNDSGKCWCTQHRLTNEKLTKCHHSLYYVVCRYIMLLFTKYSVWYLLTVYGQVPFILDGAVFDVLILCTACQIFAIVFDRWYVCQDAQRLIAWIFG